jgi:hypothetical protein
MYRIGGTCYSGTTLLALMLNQGSTVCMDEPDFHDAGQSHRGIPFLQSKFPDRSLPQVPRDSLTYVEAVDLIERCEQAIAPHALGMKTCGFEFLKYLPIYQERGYPVIAIVRDIRDALTRYSSHVTEESLNAGFRGVWEKRDLYDLWFRYEDFVVAPAAVMTRIGAILSLPLQPIETWNPRAIPQPMLKHDRHHALRKGKIVENRVGIWRRSGKRFSEDTLRTASMMGY